MPRLSRNLVSQRNVGTCPNCVYFGGSDAVLSQRQPSPEFFPQRSARASVQLATPWKRPVKFPVQSFKVGREVAGSARVAVHSGYSRIWGSFSNAPFPFLPLLLFSPLASSFWRRAGAAWERMGLLHRSRPFPWNVGRRTSIVPVPVLQAGLGFSSVPLSPSCVKLLTRMAAAREYSCAVTRLPFLSTPTRETSYCPCSGCPLLNPVPLAPLAATTRNLLLILSPHRTSEKAHGVCGAGERV